jgi:hypothetical protein
LSAGFIGDFRSPTGDGNTPAIYDRETARPGAQYGNPAIAALMRSKPRHVGVGLKLDRRKASEFRKQAIGCGF